MKMLIGTISFLTMALNFVVGQQITTNSYIPYVDEPFQFSKELKNHKFHFINLYSCPDSIFNTNKCRLTIQKTYDDSGKVIKLKSGSDLKNDKVDYIVNYISTTDSICVTLTEYKSNYIDSLSLFKYWDTTSHKTKNIYKREKNGDVVVKSILIYETRASDADTIFRYDKAGRLEQIYYPLGIRKKVKQWTDSTTLNGSKVIMWHTIFQEDKLDEYEIFSKNGTTLENGYVTTINDSIIYSQKTFYIYDDSLNLIYKNTVDAKNRFIQNETFEYFGKHLSRHSLGRNIHDPVDNKYWLYDKEGRLTELFEKDMSNSRTWKSIYTYIGDLQFNSIYFQNGQCIGSAYFIYE